jgi:glycosyltransferase involved in cell wall biosynthesis
LGPNLVAVIPCYNAGPRLRPVLDKLGPLGAGVLVVDDGSTDGCADGLGEEARVIRFERNRGKGHALFAGFQDALKDERVTCAAVLDADGQHDPAELPRLYGAFRDREADLLIGARRFEAGVPFRSRFGNVLTISLFRLLTGVAVPDTQSGYRLHSRRLLEDIVESVAPGRYETEMEILARAALQGRRVESAPIETIYESGNPSSHFHKLRDSYLIYRRLLRAASRHRRRPL